jgi:hypothetical protein
MIRLFSIQTWFVPLSVALAACVEPFDRQELSLQGELLVVDGTLTDEPEPQRVRLSRASLLRGLPARVPVEKATVAFWVNGEETVPLRETTPGTYQAPDGFRGQVGGSYQLRFTLADGRRYESAEEVLPAVPPIRQVYDRFDGRGIANAEKTAYTPANLVYVDTQDPADVRNYYRWDWTLWELQDWCRTCAQSRYVVFNRFTNQLVEDCVTDRSLLPSSRYDYVCRTLCWDILRSTAINLFADQYTNGQPILGRLVGAIPYYQTRPALLEIRQYSLTVGAYRFFQLLENQTQRTGTLADTPPAPLVGNIHNLTNASENVVGYFTASGVATLRYWLDRQNATGPPVGLYSALNGGEVPIPEPAGILPDPFGIRPPSALCVPSDTRTPAKPEGWR